MTKKILITGCAGFIGFHVAKSLLKNNIIYGVDNLNSYYDVNEKNLRIKILKKTNKKNFFFFKKNLNSVSFLEKLFEKFKFEYILHFAAQPGVRYSLINPDSYIKNNVNAFVKLIHLSAKYKIKHFIYSSSSSVYGLNKKLPADTTDSVDHPMSLYAATKRSNELIAHSYSCVFNLPTTGLRFFSVYGPHGRPDMAIYKFTKKIFNNKKIELYNYGLHKRDLNYIDYVVDFINKIIDEIPKKNKFLKLKVNNSIYPFKIYNVASGKNYSTLDVVNKISVILKKKAKIKKIALQKGEAVNTLGKRDKYYKVPIVSLENGLERFINWFLNK